MACLRSRSNDSRPARVRRHPRVSTGVKICERGGEASALSSRCSVFSSPILSRKRELRRSRRRTSADVDDDRG
jgi:hypothetical protein